MPTLACFGAGRIGRIHAANAIGLSNVTMKYLVDPIASPLRDALARRCDASIVTDDEVFSDPQVDGVIIASSTNSHADLLARAAKAGKAVFCEKPISLDFGLTRSVAQQVEDAGIPCLMGFQRRYDPSFRQVYDRITSGVSGKVEQIVMFSRDPSPPSGNYVRTSGGMFRDSSIHDVDMARFLLNEQITRVYAVGSNLISPEIREAGDVDTLTITLVTGSGRMAQIIACRRGPMVYDQRLEALCSKEVLTVGNQLGSSMSITTSDGTLLAPPENYFIERYQQAYRAEMEAFIALIHDGVAPLAGIRDGLEAQRLVEAAQISAHTGKAIDFGPDWTPEEAQKA